MGEGPGLHLAGKLPIGDDSFLILGGGTANERKRREVLFRLVAFAAHVITHNHLVAALLVNEMVVDALPLHQPGNEIEVGFAILDTILDWLIRFLKIEFVIRETGVRENLLDDFRHGFVLENPTIRSASEEPQPRNDGGPVIGTALLLEACIGDAGEEPVKVAGIRGRGATLLTRHIEAQDHGSPKQRVQIQIVPLSGELHPDLIQTSQRFLTIRPADNQSVLPQNRLDVEKTVCLCGFRHFLKVRLE